MLPALILAAVLSAEAALEATSRSTDIVARRLSEREDLLRKRLQSLYRLVRGGARQRLSESRDPIDLTIRAELVNRLLQRDLSEVAELRREHAELAQLRERLLARVERLQLERELGHRQDTRAGTLKYPVAGKATKTASDGWLFQTSPRALVRAVSPGRVIHVGPIPGFELVVLVDHGEGLVSLYANMGLLKVEAGAIVGRSQALGVLSDHTLYFELRYHAEPVDVSRWCRR